MCVNVTMGHAVTPNKMTRTVTDLVIWVEFYEQSSIRADPMSTIWYFRKDMQPIISEIFKKILYLDDAKSFKNFYYISCP